MNITYRKAHKKEIPAIASMVVNSFEHYPLFDICFRDKFKEEVAYNQFMNALLRIHIKTVVRKNVCMVGEVDSKIVSMALIVNPKHKEATIMDYILCGGVELYMRCGVRGINDIRNVEAQSEEFYRKNYSSAWFLALLAVDNSTKGQKLGSKMIEECVKPYVARQGGTAIALSTNDEKNCGFYIKNGFGEVEKKTVHLRKKSIDNWGYVCDINRE
ncbi:MAG: GNAT family N-acetyltransferase [Oscillospiraceae bacterium]|nr:GNAT family N-acetyltransferase [Oscillospiraceae bacterium]